MKCYKTLRGHVESISQAIISDDRKMIISCGDDFFIQIYSLPNNFLKVAPFCYVYSLYLNSGFFFKSSPG